MKYRDDNGELKSLVLKAQVVGDTLPIGSEVDYNGERVPEGWEEVTPDKEFFEWTPQLSCHNASEAPAVTYTAQTGYGCKIKITDTLSIVFVSVYLRGNITAISGNNYACIAGLPYTQSMNGGYSSFNFSTFLKGIDETHPMPVGYFASKTIRIQNGGRGSPVERWVVGDSFQIYGSGFYFTNE